MQYWKRNFSLTVGSKYRRDAPHTSDIWRAESKYFADVNSVYAAYWETVSGTLMIDKYGGDPLTLSVAPGTDYIPYTYQGTITPPSGDSNLVDADAWDNLLFTGATPNSLTVCDFISQDYNRIVVKYDNSSPYHIRAIGVVNPILSISTSTLNTLHDDFDLWILWSGGWNDNGHWKDNRILDTTGITFWTTYDGDYLVDRDCNLLIDNI